MSEISAPEEVASEAEGSSESPQNETDKNHSIEKLFEDFHGSPEYTEGLQLHQQKVKAGTDPETVVKGYEAQMTTPDRPLLGTGEHYKKAFMDYVGNFYEKNQVWPLNFSEAAAGPEVAEAYKAYKEAALKSKYAEGRTDVVKDADLDAERSGEHDRLAGIIYNRGTVKTFLDGKLVARLWLVSENIEGPESIVFMDKARYLRVFHRTKNIEKLGSQ